MKILIINYEYPPIGGGGGFVTRDIVEQMSAMGHQITVVTSGYKGLPADETGKGIRVIRVPVFYRNKMEVASNASMFSYLFSSISYCLAYFNTDSFDIINTHFAIPSGPTGYVLSKWFGIPNVLSIHGGDIFDPSKRASPHRTPVLSQTVRFMLNTASRLVAQSKNTRENAVHFYNIKKNIVIIPLGIRKPSYVKKKRSEFDLSDDDFVFCTIGRLIKRKNIDQALGIMSRLKENKKIKFVIIGDGPERNNLQGIIQSLDIEHNVRIMGNVSDEVKFQILDLSDCYLSTALHEGFGLVFLEAMACGLPVVCHDNGGQTDFLIDGRTGFLTPVEDIEGTINRIQSIMHDEDMRERFRNFNQKQVESFYIPRCAEKYIDLFEQTVRDAKERRNLETFAER